MILYWNFIVLLLIFRDGYANIYPENEFQTKSDDRAFAQNRINDFEKILHGDNNNTGDFKINHQTENVRRKHSVFDPRSISRLKQQSSKDEDIKDKKRQSYEAEEIDSASIERELNEYRIDTETPIWHHYTFETGAYNREELQIVEVVAEKSFYTDRRIVEWVSHKHQAVGRGEHGLTLVSARPDKIYIKNIDMTEKITSMCMFEWWSYEEKSTMVGLLVSHENVIDWYRVDARNILKPMWKWTLNDPIVHLAIFKLDDKEWRVAVTHESKEGSNARAMSIYGAVLWKDWWYLERLNGCGRPVPFNSGRYIAVILEDYATVSIYKYDYDTRRYVQYKTFNSPQVYHVSAFVVGVTSFLAIGGENPAIYEVRATDFVEQHVEHYQLEHVEFYLPMALGYYRNDALVLFQHRLDHHSHTSSVLEALQWNGWKFTLLEHSPCRSHDEEMFGFTCISDATGEKGIQGATFLRTPDDQVHILTASEEYTPMVFNVKTQLIDLPNPVHSEVVEIAQTMNHLQEKFLTRLRAIENAERILQQPDATADFFSSDYGGKVHTLIAPAVHVQGNMHDVLRDGGYVNVAGHDWRQVDLKLDTTPFHDRIKKNHERIKDAVGRLKSAVMQKDPPPRSFEEVIAYGGITVNGKVTVKSANVTYLNGINVESVLKTSVDGKNLTIGGEVIVDSLDVDNIDVKYVNGMNLLDPDHSTGPIVVDGDMEMINHLHVLKDVNLLSNGTVNGIDFKRDAYLGDVQTNGEEKCYGFVNFDNVAVKKGELVASESVNGYNFTESGFKRLLDQKKLIDDENIIGSEMLTLDSLTIDEGLTFDNINGKAWNEFRSALVMTDEDATLDEIEVSGVVTVDSDLVVEILNGLEFPNDYLLVDEPSAAVFTSSKTFVNDLQADEVNCDEAISGVVPEDIVTLSTRQNLNNFTFADLTITERLNVQGDITGKELDALLANPRLTDSREIRSNVIFRDLSVNGTLRVANRVNGTAWPDMFDGVVMKTDAPVQVDSFKTFKGSVTVRGGLNIRSGYLNDRRVSDFLTADTEQLITRDRLVGDVAFEDLQVDGRFDDVDVAELMSNSVKLIGDDRTIDADVTFDGGMDPDTMPLTASTLEVTATCNDWKIPDEVVFSDQPEPIQLGPSHFATLVVETLIIEGDLSSENSLCGTLLPEFQDLRLSKTRNKEIIATYTVSDAQVSTLNFDSLNGMTRYQIGDFHRVMRNIKDELLYGNIDIGTLHIDGDLNVAFLNGIDVHKLAENAIDLNGNGAMYEAIKFMDPIFVKDLYVEGYAYGQNFKETMLDLVQINDDDEAIIVTGLKTYKSGLNILGNISTEYINDHRAEDILSANGAQVIRGDLYIENSMYIKNDLKVGSLINGNDMKRLQDIFEYINEDTYLIKGDVTFKGDSTITIDDLIVEGLVNEEHDLRKIFTSAARKFSEANRFTKSVTFLKPVKIRGAIEAGIYNGVNVRNILKDIVLLNESTAINGDVVFTAPLRIEGKLYVEENAAVDLVQDFSISEWKDNAIYLDSWQEVIGMKSFENLTITGDVTVKYLNNMPFDNFVTLNTDQIIAGGLKFERLVLNDALDVTGYVNGVKLGEVFNNTLMVNGDQTISTPINFHSNVIVTGDAHLTKVNWKDFNKAITLDGEQTLHAQYEFLARVDFDRSLYATAGFTNVNFDYVSKRGVFSDNRGADTIKGNWYVMGDVIFESDIAGVPRIDDLTIEDMEAYLAKRDSLARRSEDISQWRYKQLCRELNGLSKVTSKKIYIFDHVEEMQKLPGYDLLSVHRFAHLEDEYILAADRWSCSGFLWKWSESMKRYAKSNRFQLGCPKQWYDLRTENNLYLIGLNSESCECGAASGTNIWNFDGINLKLVTTLDPVQSLYVSPNYRGTFYTFETGKLYQYRIQNEIRFATIRDEIYLNVEGEKKFVANVPLKSDMIITNGQTLLHYSNGKFFPLPTRDRFVQISQEIIDTAVGKYNKRLSIVAVTYGESNNATNGHIIIYDDMLKGSIVQMIPANNPSSLTIINLDSFETLLIFIEDKMAVNLYSYRGYQGFKFLYKFNVVTEKIFAVDLPTNDFIGDRIKSLVIVTDDGISVSKVHMYGGKEMIQSLPCD